MQIHTYIDYLVLIQSYHHAKHIDFNIAGVCVPRIWEIGPIADQNLEMWVQVVGASGPSQDIFAPSLEVVTGSIIAYVMWFTMGSAECPEDQFKRRVSLRIQIQL